MPSKKIYSKPLLMAILIISITGCVGMDDDFSCKKVDGLSGCYSMTDINNIVNDGKISSDDDGNVTLNLDEEDGETKIKKSVAKPKVKVKRVHFNAILNPNTPFRTAEKIAKITIFSYKDSAGNLHSAHNIFTVVEPSKWTK